MGCVGGLGAGAVRVPGGALGARRIDACTLTDSVVVLTPTESVSVIEACTPTSIAERNEGPELLGEVWGPHRSSSRDGRRRKTAMGCVGGLG